MARIRTIKPEFWTDETIVQLPFVARLLFIGLWNFADDSGCLSYSPERIKLQILPSEAGCDITALIDLLVACGLISYWVSADGDEAIAINNWSRHQKIDNPSTRRLITGDKYKKKAIPNESRLEVARKYKCKPGETVAAECYYCGMPGKIHWWLGASGRATRWVSLSDLEFDHFVPEFDQGAGTHDNIVLACMECNRSKKASSPEKFLACKHPNLFPDSPIEGSIEIVQEGKGVEKDQGPKRDIRRFTSAHVEAIYQAYPKKAEPRAAKKAIENALLRLEGDTPGDDLLKVVNEYAASPQGSLSDRELIKNPATWFNKGCYLESWKDWQEPRRKR